MLKTLGVHFIRHPCLCGRLGRCIVQRLCATAIVHPCTTRKLRVLLPAAPKIIPRLLSWRKCGGAGLSNRACSVGFASCETLGKHYRASLHDPYRASSHPPAPKKAGLCLFRHNPAFLVPMAGVEPARYCYQRILSPSRLPIPSHRLIKMCCKTALHNGNNDFTV